MRGIDDDGARLFAAMVVDDLTVELRIDRMRHVPDAGRSVARGRVIGGALLRRRGRIVLRRALVGGRRRRRRPLEGLKQAAWLRRRRRGAGLRRLVGARDGLPAAVEEELEKAAAVTRLVRICELPAGVGGLARRVGVRSDQEEAQDGRDTKRGCRS